jgi:hypothetical protein
MYHKRKPGRLGVEGEFHNRTIDGIQQSWSVDRLRALSTGISAKEVPLDSIYEFDTVYWFDDQYQPTCREVVRHLSRIQSVDLADPIILSADGHVMDGMHRVAKASLQGHSHIKAVQFIQDPDPDDAL